MTSTGLTKLYAHLLPRERLPLILAAQARGDESEQQRLAASAPVRVWRLPDYAIGDLAANVLALVYVSEQLDYAANYWHALWRLEDADDADPATWRLAADVSAYVFARNAEAWRSFWQELHIDADALSAANHHGWLLRYCEERMPGVAPTREELAARLRRHGADDPQPVTADDLRASWRQLFEACAGQVMRAGGTGRDGR
jgi:hypothetical protein